MATAPALAPASAGSTALPARPALLRAALTLDALVTGANGLLYLVAAGPLEDLLGVPAAALRGVGAFLVVFGAAVWVVSRRRPVPAVGAVRVVVAANALWVLDSLALAVLGVWSPTTVGTVWILLQAATVAGFALAQVAGLRPARSR